MAAPDEVRALAVVLTASCNLACSYCYQNSKRQRRMSWDTLRSALDLLLGSRRRAVELTFYGGEPLLQFESIRRAVAYIERSRRPDQAIQYWIFTNGTLLRRRQAAFLAAKRFRTQISFDGTAATQDLRGKGTFATLDRLLDELRQEHQRWWRTDLSVSCTVLPATVGNLARNLEYYLAKGIQEIGLSPVITSSCDWSIGQMAQLDEQFRRIFTLCLRHYRKTGKVPLDLFRRSRRANSEPPEAQPLCRVGRGESLAVDVDGQMHGCVLFAESFQTFPSDFLHARVRAMRLGDLRAPGLERRLAAYPAAVRAAEIFDRRDRKYSSYGRCRDCRYLDTCQVCPVAIGHIPGNTDPHRIPDFLCAFNRVCGAYRERFPAPPGIPRFMQAQSPPQPPKTRLRRL